MSWTDRSCYRTLPVETGLILLGVAPCITVVLVWTDLCKGNGPIGIVLMAWNLIFQIITTPLFIVLLIDTYVSVDIAVIGESILLYLGLPLPLGAITRREIIKCMSYDGSRKNSYPTLIRFSW